MAANERQYCPKCNHPNKKYYVTIKNGREKGYCFHCGYSVDRRVRGSRVIQPRVVPKIDKYVRPYDATNEWGMWPGEAIKWLCKYGITQKDTLIHDIFYAPSWGRDRLWLTVDKEHWQGRDLSGDSGIKYITKKNTAGAFSIQGNNTCLITEDVLSAIKGSKWGYSTLALSGTNLSKLHLKKLLDMDIDKVLVCLDNDNAKVKKLQEEIKKRLDNLFDCSIVRLDKDLKEYKSLQFINN